MKFHYKIFFLIFLFLINRYDIINQHDIYLKSMLNLDGIVNCEIETLLVIKYGEESGKIRPPIGEIGYLHGSGPDVFDIDEELNIYCYEGFYFYKFSIKGDLIFQKKVKYGLLDFKYFNEEIFVYHHRDKIKIYSSENFEFKSEFSIPKLKANISCNNTKPLYFSDNFLFLQYIDSFSVCRECIYNLENGNISIKISDDRFFTPIYECQDCNPKFLRDLFDNSSYIKFFGQSKESIGFGYFYSIEVDSNSKIYRELFLDYYILNKTNATARRINFGKDIDINFSTSRPFYFTNDTTFICQEVIQDKNGLSEKLICYKISFNPW